MVDIIFDEEDITEGIRSIFPVYNDEEEYQAQAVLLELVKFVLKPIN